RRAAAASRRSRSRRRACGTRRGSRRVSSPARPTAFRFTNLGEPDSSAVGDVTNAIDAAGALYKAQNRGGVPYALHSFVYRVVYALWLSGNDVASNATSGCNYSQLGPFDKAWVSISTDGGNTWTAHLAWQGSYDQTTRIGDNADKIFGTIGVDRGGQIHVLLP